MGRCRGGVPEGCAGWSRVEGVGDRWVIFAGVGRAMGGVVGGWGGGGARVVGWDCGGLWEACRRAWVAWGRHGVRRGGRGGPYGHGSRLVDFECWSWA